MADWKRRALGDLPVYQAATMAWLPNVIQGFTTRKGGTSAAPYDTLNLAGHVGDVPAHVQDNRQRLWADVGMAEHQVALAEQTHGSTVSLVTAGSLVPSSGTDALITNTRDVLLMMLYADCVPVYLLDPSGRAIGLVHSGWRGTVADIAGRTMAAMTAQFGSHPQTCLAAIGPCISGDSYEVGRDVADQFRNMPDLRAGTAVYPKSEFTGTYTLNLRQVIFSQLLGAGLRADSIAVCDEDTFQNKRDFFSYRRDGAPSGRMAAFLGIRSS